VRIGLRRSPGRIIRGFGFTLLWRGRFGGTVITLRHRLRHVSTGTRRQFVFRFDLRFPKLLELPERPKRDIASKSVFGQWRRRGRWPRWAAWRTRIRPAILTPIAGTLSRTAWAAPSLRTGITPLTLLAIPRRPSAMSWRP
jgi:hypothetical protein